MIRRESILIFYKSHHGLFYTNFYHFLEQNFVCEAEKIICNLTNVKIQAKYVVLILCAHLKNIKLIHMKTLLSALFLFIFCCFQGNAQNIILTEKPLLIGDTVVNSLKNITEIDITTQHIYGVVKIEDAGFFDLFGKPNGNALFLYNRNHNGQHLASSKKTGAIGWNCWFGALNQTMVTSTLQLNSKNETNPGEVPLFAVNYNADGKGTTYLYFDLLPDINANSSFPDLENNPYIKSAVGAVKNLAQSEKPKDVVATLTIEYTNASGEKRKISQNVKFKNMKLDYLDEVKYPSLDVRKKKQYIHSEIPQYYDSNNFDEAKAEMTKAKATSLFESFDTGIKIKYLSYAQTYTKTNPSTKELKSKAYRCLVVYTKEGKCYFGDIYYSKESLGAGAFSEPQIERFELGGELNCTLIK